jgi:hypothetical protein
MTFGCHLVYETTVQTPVLFMLKPRLEGRVRVMHERLSFGIGLPLYEFQKATATTTYRFQSRSGATCQMRWIPSGIPLDTFLDTAHENTGPKGSRLVTLEERLLRGVRCRPMSSGGVAFRP